MKRNALYEVLETKSVIGEGILSDEVIQLGLAGAFEQKLTIAR